MQSCIYEGLVTHRRRTPISHRFRYRLFMVYLDLDELPALVGNAKILRGRQHSVCTFLRSDHLFDSKRALAEELRAVIHKQTKQTSCGPIRLLTQLRYFGYYMSPLNLYYVFDEGDKQIEYVVAEVNNTPWNERHCYVLWNGNRRNGDDKLSFAHPKNFHVSPFMPMDMEYRWRLSEPGSNLKVHLANHRQSKPVFHASMTLRRRELSRRELRRMTIRYPVMTARIAASIYYQALKLWWKSCPFYTHPKPLTN